MKRVFINLPTKGFSDEMILEALNKTVKYLELVIPENVEWVYVHNLFYEPENIEPGITDVLSISESIKRLTSCDMIVTVPAIGRFGSDVSIISRVAFEYFDRSKIITIPNDILPGPMTQRSYSESNYRYHEALLASADEYEED